MSKLYSLFNNMEDKNDVSDDADKLFKCICYSGIFSQISLL